MDNVNLNILHEINNIKTQQHHPYYTYSVSIGATIIESP